MVSKVIVKTDFGLKVMCPDFIKSLIKFKEPKIPHFYVSSVSSLKT